VDESAATRAERILASVRSILREVGETSSATLRATRGFLPLLTLLGERTEVTQDQLSNAIDVAFVELYKHPLTRSTTKLTAYLRARQLLPNEQSTESLIRFVIEQMIKRSPMPVPDVLVNEFWRFFEDLFKSPELRGLGEISFDMTRLVLRTYEPLFVEVINLLKGSRRYNEGQTREVLRRAALVRGDLTIVRRQVRALRHIRAFFMADPRDFRAQARIVAAMVHEFGPFFIKMAQAAAANADFLPEEIGRELEVFHEDVPPMSEAEVHAAFMESYGQLPEQLYMGFDAKRPVRSGSIGSVYVAKKPFVHDGREVLREIVIKVGRHNVDREFIMGKMVLGLAIMSTHLWAPHSKLEPFLRSMQQQVDEFVSGFVGELDFDNEAKNQQRFYQRSLGRVWRVPALYGYTRRIIEMEYLADAASLNRAVQSMPRRGRRRLQAKLSERLLYTVFSHVFVYNELHGDLHPGNIMVGSDGDLHLIDWGNVIQLEGMWRLVWRYLAGAVLADTGLLADSLVRMSVDPQQAASMRDQIKATLDETLAKKGITPLTAHNLAVELRAGGMEGLLHRGRAVLNLIANTQQSGVVLDSDYLHLSRTLFALAGSFGSLYESTPKWLMVRDLVLSLVRMPFLATRDSLRHQLRVWRETWFPSDRARPKKVVPLTPTAMGPLAYPFDSA
jgi:ubiquinone biosynthesis protein